MLAKKKSVGDFTEADLKGKKVLVRVDFNTPLDKEGKIQNDSKIREALPTILYLMKRGARVILASHLGYFVGSYNRFYSLNQFLPRLSELLGAEVKLAHNCTGLEVVRLVDQIPDGGVLLLENLKFHEEEMSNQHKFAENLSLLANFFVNEAFPISHKKYASTVGVADFLKPAVAGLLMHKELEFLTAAIDAPNRPLIAIVGGSRLSTKFDLIKSLLGKVDKLLLGGAIIFPFYVAHVGSSLMDRGCYCALDTEDVKLAKSLIEISEETGKELVFPVDVIAASMLGPKAKTKLVSATDIPVNWMGLDIGPETIESFCSALYSAKTIIWNGPMGMYEYDKFSEGTEAIAKKLAELTGKGVKTVIVGGDTVTAVEKLGLADKMSHVSTGSLASIELLAGKELPAVNALDDDTCVVKEKRHKWSLTGGLSLIGLGVSVLILLQQVVARRCMGAKKSQDILSLPRRSKYNTGHLEILQD